MKKEQKKLVLSAALVALLGVAVASAAASAGVLLAAFAVILVMGAAVAAWAYIARWAKSKAEGREDIAHALERKRREVRRLRETLGEAEEELGRKAAELGGKEAALEKVKRELVSANRVRYEFLSSMSRELKTPLTTIVSLAEFLLSERPGILHDAQKGYLDDIIKSARDLMRGMDSIASSGAPEKAPAKGGGTAGARVKKLLLVESDFEEAAVVMDYFAGEPYGIIQATDGLEALRKVEEENPDLVLMDVILPRLDGLEACRTLKHNEKFVRFRHIPVILLTSFADTGSKIKGIQAGADDFIEKPIDRELLKERARALTGVKEEYERVLSSYREAERESATDPLTGLYNRRSMDMMLKKEFKTARRFARKLSVLMVDVDLFKEYNDRHGHQEGDRLLMRVADVFRGTVREVDTVARYGGEEFLVILPETPSDMAFVAAERTRKAVEKTGAATVSIGIATFPDDAANVEELVRRADEALYESKRAGRNRTTHYRPREGETKKAA